MKFGDGLVVLAAALVVAGCAGAPDAPEAAPVADLAENGSAAQAAPAAGPVPTAGTTGEGLSLSREQIVSVLAENGLPPESFEAQTLPDGREVFTASYPDTATRQVLWIAIFGGAQPHTVRMDYYPANALPEEAQTVGRAMDGLVAALFPDWPEATQWPEVAGAQAWDETRRHGATAAPQQIPILETRQNGVWLEALGLPRQMASYVITTSEVCRPSQADGYFEGYPACR